MAWSSVQSSDLEVRRELGRNLVLSGGSTMFEGLTERLNAEILTLAPAGAEIRVLFNTDKKYSVWNGASTFSSLSMMESFWLNARDFGEFGPSLINKFA